MQKKMRKKAAPPRKNPAAVALGRLGGLRSVEVRTPEQQRKLSHLGGLNRWKNQKKFSKNPMAIYQRARRAKMREEEMRKKES